MRLTGVIVLGIGLNLLAGTTSTLPAAANGASTSAFSIGRLLTRPQVDEIIKVTGYRGLRSHQFDIADEFRSETASIVVVQLDAARLAVPLAEVERNLAQAEQLTAAGPTFKSNLKVGPGPKQEIRYDVIPAGALAPDKPYIRYIIFVPHDEHLADLAAPEKIQSDEAMTVNKGTKRINVTLLHDLPTGEQWGAAGISADDYYAMVECLNTSSLVYIPMRTLDRLADQNVDMSYMTDPNHANPSRRQELANLEGRGREIWSNSLGFAVGAARAGISYSKYARTAARVRFSFYEQNDMRFLTVPEKQYQQFATSWHSG